jgi:hypothetical protein
MGWGAAGLGSLCLYCRGACGDVSMPPVCCLQGYGGSGGGYLSAAAAPRPVATTRELAPSKPSPSRLAASPSAGLPAIKVWMPAWWAVAGPLTTLGVPLGASTVMGRHGRPAVGHEGALAGHKRFKACGAGPVTLPRESRMGWGAAGLSSLCLYCRGACGDVSTPPVC